MSPPRRCSWVRLEEGGMEGRREGGKRESLAAMKFEKDAGRGGAATETKKRVEERRK